MDVVSSKASQMSQLDPFTLREVSAKVKRRHLRMLYVTRPHLSKETIVSLKRRSFSLDRGPLNG